MKKAIGLDIGGTKIAAGIVTEQGELLGRVEVKSDPSGREAMFVRVCEAVEQVLNEVSISIDQIEGIGAGVPGKVDRKEGIAIYQNNLPWGNFPIRERLADRFKENRIIIDNDVYMAAFAEWVSQKDLEETFVYITISTGIASSIIHKGDFIRGAGFAGELGLIPVLIGDSNERLEKIAAGPGIRKLAEKELKQDIGSTKDVFDRFLSGAEGYDVIIEQIAEYIAQGIYSISSLIDPHRIVFGGSVIVNNPFLLDLIKNKLKAHQLVDQQHLLNHLYISRLRENNGVVGAGLRVFDDSL
ncbi:ROK family protein [Pradoshia eiseniae]|uniref:ROK family protein n=1 Tax=Pradoshia eiseniae TaxID=2064768 RepID=A0A2S7N1V3_9BACI|nr:ROK family protein [Pradoshia eiseniae]PQD96014.1 ROK family protein [Pradoshia eiseniae]